MPEQSTCVNCRTYQGKHNGVVLARTNFAPNNYRNPQAPPRVNKPYIQIVLAVVKSTEGNRQSGKNSKIILIIT